MSAEDIRSSDDLFYVASVRHTQRGDRYITFWRPKNAGYAYPLSWAGKYTRDEIQQGYHNNGWDTVAVRCDAADQIAVAPAPRMIDNDAGPVVCNNAENWQHLLKAVIAEPQHEVIPQYRGQRRRSIA